MMTKRLFQSTLSVRRATKKYMDLNDDKKIISIHALREESDCKRVAKQVKVWYFNPRSPWGERPDVADKMALVTQFQSTLSVRRATKFCITSCTFILIISIHALREESDDSPL